MAEIATVARPYAKAIFDFAHATKQLSNWSAVLSRLSTLLQASGVESFIDNPTSTDKMHSDLLLSFFDNLDEKMVNHLRNFLLLLSKNNRLVLLPEIYLQFEQLRSEEEKTAQVQVKSFLALSDAQRDAIKTALCKRLQRTVTLQVDVDKDLLGGVVIRANDLVIDGSVRGQLEKLAAQLTI